MLQSILPLALVATLAGPIQDRTSLEGGAAAVGAVPPDSEYDGSAGQLRVQTPALAEAGIRVDGVLDEPAWERAALLHAFTQYEPSEGVAAFRPTRVRVFVDDDAIYFAILAEDDPAGIRATLGERDSFTRSDDYVRIMLDTFDDQRRAYVFSVNPLGVQHDGIWNDGGSSGRRGGFGPPIDDNPDFLWESDARMTPEGYQVEVKIPFKSLRFPEVPVQQWGIQVARRIQRNGYQSSWAPLTSNSASQLTQFGKLAGLRDLDPGMFMEINPVLTGNRFGAEGEDGVFGHDDPDADFGLNFTYGLTSNLTLDATYNPDFSQVEADAGQISVNERFAQFFPEKRPFFLEGTEIFGMPKQLVYTRSIQNPVGGAKLTGKVGSFQMGYIGAVDEGFDADGPNTLVNLFRLRKDVGGSSTLGAVYTDRTVASDDFNRVAGADARLVFADRYTVTLMGAASLTERPDDLGESLAGQLLSARIERAGRTFSFNAELEDTDEDFEAGSGFFRRVGDTQLSSRANYSWFGRRGGLVESVSPSLEFRGWWDHDDFWAGAGLQEAQVQAGWRLSFRNNITFWGNHQREFYSYGPEAYEGLFVRTSDEQYLPFRPDQDQFGNLGSTTLSVWLSNWQRVRGNVRMTFSDTPLFDRRLGVPTELASSVNVDGSMTLYLTQAFQTEIGLRHTSLTREDGREYSTATIPRIRAQYQFSRALFVRGIFEYASQERGALLDPATGLPLYGCANGACSLRDGSDDHDFHVEGLVTYEPSPGTVFYVGYTRDMRDTRAFRFRDVEPVADGLFVKLSYRFRF